MVNPLGDFDPHRNGRDPERGPWAPMTEDGDYWVVFARVEEPELNTGPIVCWYDEEKNRLYPKDWTGFVSRIFYWKIVKYQAIPKQVPDPDGWTEVTCDSPRAT